MEHLVKSLVEAEFGPNYNRFDLINFQPSELVNIPNLYRPGVYVFYMDDKVWKVGKHNTNAYSRSLQHFRDDTGSNIGKGMKQYKDRIEMRGILFLIKNKTDLHWIYALECFLENKFRNMEMLLIPAGRR